MAYAIDPVDAGDLAFLWLLFILSTLFTCARLFVQLKFHYRPWRECFVVLAWALCGIYVLARSIQMPTESEQVFDVCNHLQTTTMIQVFYACKAALLCFFMDLAPRHVFPKTWWAIRITWICIIVAAVDDLVSNIMQGWLDTIPYDTHPEVKIYWADATMIIHMFTDLQVLAVPIPILWYLPITRGEKLRAYGLFAFGFINVVSAAIWTAYMFIRSDSLPLFIFIKFLLDFQLGTAVIVVCLPYCLSLWNMWRGRSGNAGGLEGGVIAAAVKSPTAAASTQVTTAPGEIALLEDRKGVEVSVEVKRETSVSS